MSKTTTQDIKATLWKAAGTFRGTIDAANYKDFVLSMLFLKYLDDTYKEFLRDLEERYKGNQIRIERAKKNLPFVLGEKERFDYLYENRFDRRSTTSHMLHLAKDVFLLQQITQIVGSDFFTRSYHQEVL